VEFVEAEKLGAVDVEGSSGERESLDQDGVFHGDGGRYRRKRK
jgi:hypothetical protein